jgi:folate-dependent phosphoribosylglycinamide formyltransferase PurN
MAEMKHTAGSIALDWGWGRKPFAEQLAGTNIATLLTASDFLHVEKDAKAILRLHLRGIISDSQQASAIKRAQKRMVNTAQSHANERSEATSNNLKDGRG